MAKIAIIEDDPSIAEMYRIKLSLAGYEVKVAGDGIEGLVLCESFMPDIVLLDIKMPHLSGDQMLKKMRSMDWSVNMQVVMLTNLNKSEAPSILQFLGVERYIVKAHTIPSQVVELVQELLLRRKHAS